MDAQEIRVRLEHRGDLGLGDRDALCAVHVVGRGHRETAFPPGRGVETRIGRDQAVQQGRAGARETQDHERRRHALLEDLRMAPHPVAAAQPRDQDAVQPSGPEITTAGREPRFLAQRARQDAQRCLDVRLVELGETRLRARVRDQLVRVERGLPAHRAPLPKIGSEPVFCDATPTAAGTGRLRGRSGSEPIFRRDAWRPARQKSSPGPSVAPGPG